MGNSLENSVLRVLNGSKVKKMKPFTIGPFTISPSSFQTLATYIKWVNAPQIKYNPNLSSQGMYNPKKNILWFNFASATKASQKALVIHEATHAVLDMEGVKTNIKFAETFAYIAQCQYMMIAKPNYSRIEGSTKLSDIKWAAAWSVAKKLQLGGIVEGSDYEAVASGVKADPTYKDECHQIADYKGIM